MLCDSIAPVVLKLRLETEREKHCVDSLNFNVASMKI
jgi:hypothetical protein